VSGRAWLFSLAIWLPVAALVVWAVIEAT